MWTLISEYESKNGITFHHAISPPDGDVEDFLPPESHHMCEIILLLSGTAKFKIEGQSYTLSPYDAIIIHPNKLHSREANVNQPYERMVLQFQPNLLPSFADLNLLSNYTDYFLPSILPRKIIEKSNLISLMNQCESLCSNQNKYTDLKFVSIILQMVETLNELVLQLDKNKHDYTVIEGKISHACIKYINQNLTSKEKLTPEYLANELHISPSHLRHTFKKEIGVSLNHYIIYQKMQLARQLILQGQSAQAVSNYLNYEYYSTFYNSFVKIFGISPTSLNKNVPL